MRTWSLFFAAAYALAAQTALPPAANVKVDFIRDIEPLLARKCHSCHGDAAQQAGLRLDRRQQAMRGGDYGPVILPGRSADSKLIKRLAGGDGGMQMPPTGPLETEEIALLRAWIDQGADWRVELKQEAPPKPIDPKVQSLIGAVRAGNAAAVKKALDSNPELVKAADATQSTLLHHAAAFGSLDMLRLLLAKGADPNAPNRRKATPLHWAVYDEARVRALIEAGANIDAKQADGRTALYQAASLGNANAALRLLLDKGANANAASSNGATPLMAASTRGDVEAMRMLLDRKAEVNARAANGGTALMSAATSNHTAAVQLLIDRGADVKLTTKKGDTALMDAATSGNADSVRLLLDKGADVNARGERGYTALMYAAASDAMTTASVRMLLDKGADTSPVADGETARSLAVKRGDTAIARLLGASEESRKQAGIAPTPDNAPRPVPVAVTKALSLLETQSHNFIRIAGCNSCHAQDLPSTAAAIARSRGIPAPKSIAQLPESMRGIPAERVLDLAAAAVTSLGWELLDFSVNRVPPNDYTDAAVRYIQWMQTAEGNWRAVQGRRPPVSAGEPLVVALSIYAMQAYGPAGLKAETDAAIARARTWLLNNSKPANTQDQAFHVMGLAWAKANPAAIDRAAKALAAGQRPDGGWAQLAQMGSDAHATGQALYALHLAGEPPSSPVYKRGVAYLLRTQAADGSWHVKTRSIWLQPYFESGFPYAHDQWISAAGTAWASMALAVTEGPRTLSQR